VLPARAVPVLQRVVASAVRDEPSREAFLQSFLRGRWQQIEQQLDAAASGDTARSEGWASLIERLLGGVERGSRQWTGARRKDGVQRVLSASRGDAQRLQHRLTQLVASWETDHDDAPVADDASGASAAAEPGPTVPVESAPAEIAAAEDRTAFEQWPAAVVDLGQTVACALPAREQRGGALALSLEALIARVQADGAADEFVRALASDCEEARHLFRQRHQLFAQMQSLCSKLTEGLTELAEDDSSAKGQCESMRARLADEPTARGMRSASELLRSTRERQRQLKRERSKARDALKTFLHRMLQELDELGVHAGRFQGSVNRHADVIESADSLESLVGAVRALVDESRDVHRLVSQTHQRLQAEHARASELSQRVQSLESELRQLSEEVLTDPLTLRRRRVRCHAAGSVVGTGAGSALARATCVDRSAVHAREEQVFFTFSAGLTLYRPGESIEQALDRADEALYEAKRAGKNRTCIA
jgi:diguanylate cyclase